MHRARRLAVSREKVLVGVESPVSVVTQEDVIIYLQWLICHLHSVKSIHNFLHVRKHKNLTKYSRLEENKCKSLRFLNSFILNSGREDISQLTTNDDYKNKVVLIFYHMLVVGSSLSPFYSVE